MRKSGEWMVLWDDRILEICRNDEDNICKVGELAKHEHIRISQPSVSRRCNKLAEHGLLRPIGSGVYVLTERGERYLDGEISTYKDEPDEVPQVDEETNDLPSTSGPETP